MIFVGEKIKLSAQFTDDSGTNTSPSTPVTITHVQEDGTVDVDEVTVSEGSTGFFEYEYTIAKKGTNHYAFESADGAIEEDQYYAYGRKAKGS